MLRRTLLSLAAATLLATPALAADIFDTAVANGNLKRLVQSIEAAGLMTTLKGAGPFTIFAPHDNGGFMKIEEGGEFEQLLLQKPKLTNILNYHIVPGRFLATDLKEGMKLTTVQGAQITVTLAGGPKVNGARIIAADIVASNGVIQVIDALLAPPQ